jgi:hypothetical protein
LPPRFCRVRNHKQQSANQECNPFHHFNSFSVKTNQKNNAVDLSSHDASPYVKTCTSARRPLGLQARGTPLGAALPQRHLPRSFCGRAMHGKGLRTVKPNSGLLGEEYQAVAGQQSQVATAHSRRFEAEGSVSRR